MKYLIASLVFCLTVVAAIPTGQSRIVGGAVTTVNQYPFIASTIYSRNGVTFVQACAGSIINNRAVLSSASCYAGDPPNRWRIRVGSSFANSGGVIHNVYTIIIHPNYNALRRDNDIALVRSSTIFTYTNTVGYISIANTGYFLPDQAVVWALGWGRVGANAAPSEQLRVVQVWTINNNVCLSNYHSVNFLVTNNMICSGWLNVGSRGQCDGDNGGPLIHNNVLVGVFSWVQECGSNRYPDINTRVSNYVPWIQANA